MQRRRSPRLDRVAREDVVGHVGVEDGGQLRRPRHGPAPRLAQRRPVRRGDERQRLGVMLDLAADRDEDRLVALDRADDVLARDVVGGDDHDLRPVEVGIEVERIECGVRVGRADRGAVPGARGRRCRRCRGPCRSASPDLRAAAAQPGGRDRGPSCRAGRRAHRARSSRVVMRTDDTIGPGPRWTAPVVAIVHRELVRPPYPMVPTRVGRPYHPGHWRPARGRCPVHRG